jgi:hypothetical protein
MQLVPTATLMEHVQEASQGADRGVPLLCVLMNQDDSSNKGRYKEGEDLLQRVSDIIDMYARIGWSVYWAVLNVDVIDRLTDRLRPIPAYWTVVRASIKSPDDPSRKTFGRLDSAAHDLAKTRSGHLHVLDDAGNVSRSVLLT